MRNSGVLGVGRGGWVEIKGGVGVSALRRWGQGERKEKWGREVVAGPDWDDLGVVTPAQVREGVTHLSHLAQIGTV